MWSNIKNRLLLWVNARIIHPGRVYISVQNIKIICAMSARHALIRKCIASIDLHA